MKRRPTRHVLLALAALLVPFAAVACGAENNDTNDTRASSPTATSTAAIGPNGGVGPAPRDMPGGGRGSAPQRGKGGW